MTKPSVISSPSPRVSIIIPTFNNALFLPQALDSVLNQTYTSHEIIVVDDGSTDETSVVLEPYLKHIHYVYQANTGSASARNFGMQLAKGEFVVFLDADDYFLADKLTDQVDYFDKQPNFGIINSGWHIVNKQGKTIVDVEPWLYSPQLNLETWLLWKPIFLGAMMIRRQWLEKVSCMDSRLNQAHDVDLILRLSLAGCKASWLPKITVSYRRHEFNKTRNGPQQVQSIHMVLDNFFSKSNIPRKISLMENKVRYYTSVWNAYHLYRTGYKDEMITELSLSLNYTPHTVQESVFNWIAHFARWLSGDKHSKDELLALCPHFQATARLNDSQWLPIERLLNWWMSKCSFHFNCTFGDFKNLWCYYQRAVQFEKSMKVPIEKMLDWWIDLWLYYRYEKK